MLKDSSYDGHPILMSARRPMQCYVNKGLQAKSGDIILT